ncbi:unnamed protein product [Protopolystoma xenopodis]|uniref:Peptidase S1 domain-containing protein n=1 Tax=Protopolystoma xenopodis TaxID=117903 RepID=A0A3S5CJI8_9PLAT|nr:unnamed protein product [Protopolystoma xenopodis]
MQHLPTCTTNLDHALDSRCHSERSHKVAGNHTLLSFLQDDLEWDIALIKLSVPLDLARMIEVSSVRLPPTVQPENWPKAGEVCVLVGWGCTRVDGGPSTHAQMARFQVVANKDCSQMYQHNAGLNEHHEFCAGYYNANLGICPGDSGSGLVCNREGLWYLIGVASATHATKPSKFPGLFTRVSHFRGWIDKMTTA